MSYLSIITLSIFLFINSPASAGSGHDHAEEKSQNKIPQDSLDSDQHDNHTETKDKGDGEHDDPGEHESDESHDDHGGSKFGKGKAIEEVKDKGKNFQLAENAIKTLNIGTITLNSPSKGFFEVPTSSVVEFQKEIAVYKRNGDWFELVEIKVVRRGKYSSQIKSKNLAKGDELVNKGVSLLHVAHLEASGQGGQGHIH